MRSPPDENLVVAFRSGDKRAYELLVRRHYRNVFAVCLGILGNVHDAEDAAQDAMVKAYVSIKQLRNSSKFRFWIVKIAKNLCVTMCRRRKRATPMIAPQQAQPTQTEIPLESLQWAIERLPQKIRLPLIMYYFDGESAQTVAEKLNMSRAAVYRKLREAARELHELLARQGDVK